MAGLLKVNEGREEIGYAPVDDGDMRYAPSGATGAASSLLGNADATQNAERQNEDALN
jgi:hypothetical protein